MEAQACTPPNLADDAADDAIEVATDLPQSVLDAYTTVAQLGLSADHAFLLGTQLLQDYLIRHIEEVTDLSDEMAGANVTAELTEQERINRLGALSVWAADQGRIEGAMDLLQPLISAAIAAPEDDDDAEQGELIG